MVRKAPRTQAANDTALDTSLAPKHMTKQEFGKRLYKLMLSKGWTQSELARRAGNMPRDSVSVYIRGKSLPTPLNLQKLAKALGVKEEELLPNHIEGVIDSDHPAFEMRQSPNTPGVCWLRVNRLVSMKTALAVADLLTNDDAVTDRK